MHFFLLKALLITYVFRHSDTHTHTGYVQTQSWFPPLFCILFPPSLFSCKTGETPLCNDSCCHIAMCLVKRTVCCRHLSGAHKRKNSGHLFPCEAVSFMVTLFNNGTSTGEVIHLTVTHGYRNEFELRVRSYC